MVYSKRFVEVLLSHVFQRLVLHYRQASKMKSNIQKAFSSESLMIIKYDFQLDSSQE